MSEEHARRLGDVAILARGSHTLLPPPIRDLKEGRHGSLTAPEMRVPLLYALA